MQILAQHGSQASDKVSAGLRDGYIDGVIFGAKEISSERLSSDLVDISENCPSAARLFDPHYYATFIASDPGARLGYLIGDKGHGYFRAHLRADLQRRDIVREDIRACLQYQASLPLTALIAPNIVVRRSLDSIEGVIARNFIRETALVAAEVDPSREVYATLAISQSALREKTELQSFLQEITELDEAPTGFYLLIEKIDTTPPLTLTERDCLARWMLVNYTLKVNGYKVINGYTDLLAPYISATGADAAASGWFGTLKNFSLKKFEPNDSHGVRPVPRYTSAALLKSIRHTELDALRRQFPEILTGLSSDAYYDVANGSRPEPTGECIQNWDAIRAMVRRCARANVLDSIAECTAALYEAETLYAQIGRFGYPLRERSNSDHLAAIGEELEEFRRLSEV